MGCCLSSCHQGYHPDIVGPPPGLLSIQHSNYGKPPVSGTLISTEVTGSRTRTYVLIGGGKCE